jgi:hypothetical protein
MTLSQGVEIASGIDVLEEVELERLPGRYELQQLAGRGSKTFEAAGQQVVETRGLQGSHRFPASCPLSDYRSGLEPLHDELADHQRVTPCDPRHRSVELLRTLPPEQRVDELTGLWDPQRL